MSERMHVCLCLPDNAKQESETSQVNWKLEEAESSFRPSVTLSHACRAGLQFALLIISLISEYAT